MISKSKIVRSLLGPSTMRLIVFHGETLRLFQGKRGRKSRFGHVFGGPADYTGLRAFKRQPAVHVLFRLNLDDPAIGIALPGSRWLPLLCAIRYGACNLGYRVISDAKVDILHQEQSKAWHGFPYHGYPKQLPERPVRFEEVPYDPENPRDVLFGWGVFGISHLTVKQYQKLKRHIRNDPHLQVVVSLDYATVDDFLQEGVASPFVQGRPVDGCPDSSCPRHKRTQSMRTFAVFQEQASEVRNLWGPSCESLQIIYQICPKCSAIRVSNQCT